MIQSTLDYHPSKYADIRHSKQTGPVPPHFRCHRCQQRGSHWVYNCPLGLEGKRVKRSTGIPRSFMNTVEGPWVPGAMMTPDGTYAVVAPAESLVVPPPTTAPPEMPPPAPDSTPSASKTRTKEAEKRIPIQRWDGQPRGPGKPSRSRYKPYRRRDLVQLWGVGRAVSTRSADGALLYCFIIGTCHEFVSLLWIPCARATTYLLMQDLEVVAPIVAESVGCRLLYWEESFMRRGYLWQITKEREKLYLFRAQNEFQFVAKNRFQILCFSTLTCLIKCY